MPIILLRVTLNDILELSEIRVALELGLNVSFVLHFPGFVRNKWFDDNTITILVPETAELQAQWLTT